MAFKLPDLIIESILRDGFNNARRDETVIDDVFHDLSRPFASKKYGQEEIEKIKKMMQKREVSIVHAFNLVPSSMPCVSIQLSDDREDTDKANMGDFIHYQTQDFSTPEQIASTIYVDSFQPTSYDPKTGIVVIPDSVTLQAVYPNLILVDSTGLQFPILGGINDTVGHKQVIISKGLDDVSLAPGATIQTSINYEKFERRDNRETTQITLGIHTKDALTTKYLYILVKYFILSRKKDMTFRGLQLNTYSGTDFNRNQDYGGDVVYSRFLQISGFVENSWRSDKVQLVDSVQVTVTVPKDRLDNEELNRTDQTVQVTEPQE